MREDLDHLMTQLAAGGPNRSLDGLEHTVMSAVRRRREDRSATRALAPIRLASVSLALAIGVTAGGMAAVTTLLEPRQLSPFSTEAHLAPSTLLDGGR